MGWVKGANLNARLITSDVEKKLDIDTKQLVPVAKQMQDATFMELGVYDTGLSKEESYVKRRTIKKGVRFYFGGNLEAVPYIPYWYNGWGSNSKKGARPVYQVTAIKFAKRLGLTGQDVTAKSTTSKIALNNRGKSSSLNLALLLTK